MSPLDTLALKFLSALKPCIQISPELRSWKLKGAPQASKREQAKALFVFSLPASLGLHAGIHLQALLVTFVASSTLLSMILVVFLARDLLSVC